MNEETQIIEDYKSGILKMYWIRIKSDNSRSSSRVTVSYKEYVVFEKNTDDLLRYGKVVESKDMGILEDGVLYKFSKEIGNEREFNLGYFNLPATIRNNQLISRGEGAYAYYNIEKVTSLTWEGVKWMT